MYLFLLLLTRARFVSTPPQLTQLKGAIACKFRGSGQTCVCANRIYVHSSIYADFASKLAEKVAAFKVGNGLDPATSVPLSLSIFNPS